MTKTGAQHYRRAEALVDRSEVVDGEFAMLLVEQAKVHALLAVAAATSDAVLEAAANEATR